MKVATREGFAGAMIAFAALTAQAQATPPAPTLALAAKASASMRGPRLDPAVAEPVSTALAQTLNARGADDPLGAQAPSPAASAVGGTVTASTLAGTAPVETVAAATSGPSTAPVAAPGLSGAPGSLHALLLADPATRARVLADTERLLENEVNAKSGLSGLLIKGAYKMVNMSEPRRIHDALDSLLDDFVAQLEPFWAAHRERGGGDFVAALTLQADQVADGLLAVTDARAQSATSQLLKAAYARTRPQGKGAVEQAVPGLARVLAAHLE